MAKYALYCRVETDGITHTLTSRMFSNVDITNLPAAFEALVLDLVSHHHVVHHTESQELFIVELVAVEPPDAPHNATYRLETHWIQQIPDEVGDNSWVLPDNAVERPPRKSALRVVETVE